MRTNRLFRSIVLLSIISGSISLSAEGVPRPGGTVKISSRPLTGCVIRFRGLVKVKKESVLTFRDVPPGDYSVRFELDGKMVEKSITVRSGRTTPVFGDLEKTSTGGMSTRSSRYTPPPMTGLRSPEPHFAGRDVPDADLFYETAEMLRKAVNPLMKAERYKRAEKIYLMILERWPNCDKVEECRFQLGNLYESIFYRDYESAIEQYEALLTYNYHTPLTARWRIALLQKELGREDDAIAWFDRAAAHSPDESVRERAAEEAKVMREEKARRKAEEQRKRLEAERERAMQAAIRTSETVSGIPLSPPPMTGHRPPIRTEASMPSAPADTGEPVVLELPTMEP